jgi:nicotinate-nucleotide adenylyltransferase
MTLGVLGGTFDPIHNGHLAAGLRAQAALGLAQVLVVPSRMPPHRAAGASPEARMAMASLAAAEQPGWTASDLELKREGPSYTFDTLTALRATSTQQFFFIIGADAFAEIATWARYPAVLDLAHFAVVARPGITLDSLQKRLPDLAVRMTTPDWFKQSSSVRPAVILIQAETPDVSSTTIRRRVRAGESISELVPASVASYISTHRLYVEATL